MKRHTTIIRFVAVLFFTLCMSGVAVGEDVRQSLFREAEEAFAAARKARADLLAPMSFGEAVKYFEEAESDFQKGKKLERIQDDLKKAVAYLHQSVNATKLSELTFTGTIQGRMDAQKAGAPGFSPLLWKRAEQAFLEATTQLEKGDVNAARKKGDGALSLYRDAELDAIKNNLLSETRGLVQEAEKKRAKNYVPKTYQSAKDKLQQAEAKLTENRYDTDEVRNLVQSANYEARHALYLTDRFLKIKDRAMTLEDFALDFEGLLSRMAYTADIPPAYDDGFHKTAIEIMEYIERAREGTEKLRRDISERNQRIQIMEEELRQLETKLGGAQMDEMAMKERVEKQAMIQAKFKEVETMFTKDEANVFRQGGNVYIRLVGLSFDVNQSILKSQNFNLLSKALDAIRVFPGSRIVVEGHTDALGRDDFNLTLSRERADVVRQYILANMEIDPELTSSIGYGESRPIANNETRMGRALNRRIDIVIVPNIWQMM